MIVENIIGFDLSNEGSDLVQAINPSTEELFGEQFTVATSAEIERAISKANEAFKAYKNLSGAKKADFLESIAEEILALGSSLIERASAESGLPQQRIIGERGRTINQLKLFASLLREGSWVEATIDLAQTNRQPIAKPDMRKMLIPIGPVVVFTASNFPLAFSTAGGDTASALAAGNPVIVKAHPAHLGTNALVASAIQKAAQKTAMPDGVFSSLVGNGNDLGAYLVKHPVVKAVAFTGSFNGGKALFDLANQRPTPIPVFAEMSSINPVILLTNKLAESQQQLATDLAQSINLGAGQFCTNPGLIIGIEGQAFNQFSQALANNMESTRAQTMLHKGIWSNFTATKQKALSQKGVQLKAESQLNNAPLAAKPTLAHVTGSDFLGNSSLLDEVFGPYSLLVSCKNQQELKAVLASLNGQLTTTFIGNDADFEQAKELVEIAKEKAGRVLFNGVPTGVEVSHAMVHGGPFPATTASNSTSVGSEAIKRFVRPVCLQNAPQSLLPKELKDDNPLNIWRKVDGNLSKTALK